MRRSWAGVHEPALLGFIGACRSSMQWLSDPANRGVAEALLVANIGDMTPSLATATATAERLLAEKGGLLRDLVIDPAALKNVLALRSRYATPQKQLDEIDRYVDLSYIATAASARGVLQP